MLQKGRVYLSLIDALFHRALPKDTFVVCIFDCLHMTDRIE